MHEPEEGSPNAKVILLAVGGAVLAGLLVALARRGGEPEPRERVAEAAKDLKKEAKKAAKAAKKKQKEARHAAESAGERITAEMRESATRLGIDAKAAERDLKAAAWDAQQEARAAESRLRAAGSRVVDETAHLASRVGAEARNLAGESRERISHLRHREDVESATERELARLRAEIDEPAGAARRRRTARGEGILWHRGPLCRQGQDSRRSHGGASRRRRHRPG